jgi:hypothetical protein
MQRILKKDVRLGNVYEILISGWLVPVRIVRALPPGLKRGGRGGGWIAVNERTNREVTIRSAARLHRLLRTSTGEEPSTRPSPEELAAAAQREKIANGLFSGLTRRLVTIAQRGGAGRVTPSDVHAFVEVHEDDLQLALEPVVAGLARGERNRAVQEPAWNRATEREPKAAAKTAPAPAVPDPARAAEIHNPQSEEPRRYLSRINATQFTVLDKSMPEIANTTRERAVAQFRRFDTTTEDIPVWDGDAGRFTTLSALEDDGREPDSTTLGDLVRIAADRVEDLRGIDAYRVLDLARQRQHREHGLLDRMIKELGARRPEPEFLSYVVEAAAELDAEHGTHSLVPALRAAFRHGGRVYDQVVRFVKERQPELAPTLNSVDPRRIVSEAMRRRR